MENQGTKLKGICKDAGSRIMRALKENRLGDAEEILKGFIEAGRLFGAESAAQEIGRKLTVKELIRVAEVCGNGDEDKAEVALLKAEKAAIEA